MLGWLITRLVLVGASAMPLIAQIFSVTSDPTSASGGDWLNYLLSGGPFAVVVLLLVNDRLTTPGERDRLRKELTASHLREAQLNQTIRDDFVPNMTRSIEAMALNREMAERVLETLERVSPTMERVNELLDEISRKGG